MRYNNEILYTSLQRYLEKLKFKIHNSKKESSHELMIVSSELYVIDCLHINFKNTPFDDKVYFTCYLGKLKKELPSIFKKSYTKHDIIENLFLLNINISNEIFFNIEKSKSYEKLTLNSYISLNEERELNDETIHNILTSLCSIIREYIEFIQYITLSDDQNYIYTKNFKN